LTNNDIMAVNHAVSFSMACDNSRFMIPAARTAHFDLKHAKKGAARRHPCHKHQFDISASTQQHLLSVQHLSACSTSTAFTFENRTHCPGPSPGDQKQSSGPSTKTSSITRLSALAARKLPVRPHFSATKRSALGRPYSVSER